ncbi:MAG: hypothetical protein CMF82_03845 [Candidatus Marinimicrobia bacterium]|nr:hypothetical protein [Candidatus Neomarinimicrobiota bacterium]|tara:strand:- start:7199 stop:7555 length:357 start_codon:yes stop_codon:yes gene_type:complete
MDIDKYKMERLMRRKTDIFNELNVDHMNLVSLHEALKYYHFVESLSELETGRYIRWIKIMPNNTKLTNGGFICDIYDDIIVCKNGFHRVFNLSTANNYIFQKFLDEELMIINALEKLR